MNFGLGLVLSFTDNASAGINNAVNSLNQLTRVAENANTSLNQMASLSALSVVTDQMGSAFLNTGGTILSTFAQIIGKVKETGLTLITAERQLDALYAKSGKSGKEVISNIQDYAKTSMFAFEDLIGSITTLKSVGIEAFDTITSSAGNSSNNLLDYASALASFAPQMKNAYGTGINAAIGALREYIAEGNEMSLKRGAGLDLTGILGEDKGATIEERTRQVADLIEQLGMMGMIDAMKNSPETMIGNMGDVLFQLLGMISSSGVYDKFNQILGKLAEYVMAIPEKELQSIAKTIGGALTTIMSPLEWIVDKIMILADGLRKLVENNPALVKILTIGVAIAGVLLMLGGVILKITSAFSGLSLMLLTFGKSFKDIGSLIKTGSLKILSTLLPLTATIGIMYLAWKNDLGGIRTNVSYFVNGLVGAFRTAYRAVNGSVSDMVVTLNQLKSKNDFFSNLTIGLMKLMMLFKALADAWNDNTLSEENYLKAKALGILPLIEAILTLKWLFGYFKQGFIDGWKEIGEKVKEFVGGLLESLDGTFLGDLLDELTGFLQKLTSKDTDAWYDFGHSFAYFTAYALAFWSALKVIGGLVKILSPIVTVFRTLWGVVKSVVTVLGNVISTVTTFLSTVTGLTTTVIGGIYAVVAGVALAITGFVKQLIDGFSWFWEIVKWVGIAIGVVGAIIAGASALPAVIVGAIAGAITTLIVVIKDNWNAICQFFSDVVDWICTNIIDPVAGFFKGLWESVSGFVISAIDVIKTTFNAVVKWIDTKVIQPIAKFFKDLWDKVVGFVKSAITTIKSVFSAVVTWINNNVIQPIFTFFKNLWEDIVQKFNEAVAFIKDVLSKVAGWIYDNVVKPIIDFFENQIFPIIEKLAEIVEKVIEIVSTLFSVFVQWLYDNVITPIVNFFVGLWNTVTEGVTSFIEGFKTLMGTIANWVNDNVLTPISNFFSVLWTTVTTGITTFITGFKEKFTAVKDWIKENVIDKISGFFTTLWSTIKTGITSFISSFKTSFEGVRDWVSESVVDKITGFFSSAWTTIKSGVSTFITGLKTSFEGLRDWISTNIVDKISGFFTTLWSTIKTSFSTVTTTVSTAFKNAINAVLNTVVTTINGFIKGINAAIDVINKIPGVSITKLTELSVPKLAEGGVVDKPTYAMIGEAGTEAVMPLENNLGWIGRLATMISSEMNEGMRPYNSRQNENNGSKENRSYLTTSSNSYHTIQGNTDNSVVFNEGAIQIMVQNATEAEAMRMAKKIMEYIKRQQELDRMFKYA